MAKRRRSGPDSAGTSSETRMINFAEDLGRLLGTAQAKASTWLNQRQQIAKQLTQVRDTAERLLGELTSSGAKVAAGVRRGARQAAGSRQPRPRRRMSAETRKRLSEAAKKRWAARRAATGGKSR
jgi:hypothetical protein